MNREFYHVKGIRVISQDSDVTYTAEELDVNAYFGVGETYAGNDKSNYMEMESVAQSENERRYTERGNSRCQCFCCYA